LRRRFPHAEEVQGAAPPEIRHAVDGIVALIAGERRDLADIAVDMTVVSPFDRRVLEAIRGIPPGETKTYGEVAKGIGHAGAAREVGGALGRNPFPIVVPCHRVLAAGGKTGGFSGTGGVATKLRLLAIERSAGPLFDGMIG
jgi:methylated-DNA-[protein]-cysteine S-methyltransferase